MEIHRGIHDIVGRVKSYPPTQLARHAAIMGSLAATTGFKPPLDLPPELPVILAACGTGLLILALITNVGIIIRHLKN